MESPSLTGQIRDIVRRMLKPPSYEARVVSALDSSGRVYVTSRPLTGSGQRLGPFDARHLHYHDGEDVVSIGPGDTAWVTVDESGEPSHLSGWRPS